MKILKSIIFTFTILFLSINLSTAAHGESCSDCYKACEDNDPIYQAQINSCKQYCNDFNIQCGGGSSSTGNSGGSSTSIETHVSGFFKIKSLDTFIPNTVQVAIAIGSLLAFIYLIWGGLEYLTSGGNQDQVKSAKSKMSNAIVGLAIVASIWVLWRLVTYFLGLSSSPSGTFKIKVPKP